MNTLVLPMDTEWKRKVATPPAFRVVVADPPSKGMDASRQRNRSASSAMRGSRNASACATGHPHEDCAACPALSRACAAQRRAAIAGWTHPPSAWTPAAWSAAWAAATR